MHYVPKTLFSVDTNPKTVKGQRLGFRTAVLYMAPARLSGVNLCPMAHIAQCEAPCLNTAGNPAYAHTKEKGRLNKAHYFLRDRNGFLNQMVREVFRFAVAAMRDSFTPLVRPNGTTDIRWERESFTLEERTVRLLALPEGMVGTSVPNIMSLFPWIQWYDYTKIANRKDIPSNYDLTFSYSGVEAFGVHVARARAAGMRIAVVFRDRKTIPSSFLGMTCVDGDDTDIRHLDPQGVIVALYAKGRARTDTSGFVVDTERRVIPLMAA
jgi:hypothetical protein